MTRTGLFTTVAALGLGVGSTSLPARADAPIRPVPACAPAAAAADCRAVRAASRPSPRPHAERAGAAWVPPSRYVSLLILGVGY